MPTCFFDSLLQQQDFGFIYLPHIKSRATDKRGYEDNSKIFFFSLHNENTCCDTSAERSQQDNSNDGSQHTF